MTASAATITEVAASSDIMLLPSPRLEVLSFAVSVPASTTMDTLAFDDDYYEEEEATTTNTNDPLAVEPKRKPLKPAINTSSMDGIGMVGTITVLKTSYIIWFGWGQTQDQPLEEREGVNCSRIVGSTKGNGLAMGQCLIAMPPRKFGGTVSESSTSKLIGGDYDDDMIARPMACRLSQKCGRPVLISCSLDPAHIQSMGLDPDLLHGRAAALAEKRIWELLKQYHA